MTATTGSDASGPVEYYFDETSGNPGGSDSGWQTSPSYTDTGLSPSTQYTYTVQMRDSAPMPNVGTASSPANATTDAGGTPYSQDIVVVDGWDSKNGKTLDESRGSVRRGIQMVEVATGAPSLLMGQSLEDIAARTAVTDHHPDAIEGGRAFLEKRSARFNAALEGQAVAER